MKIESIFLKTSKVLFAILTATLVLVGFAPFAHAAWDGGRANARFQAGLVREAAPPAEGESSGSGGSNGGESGGGGSQEDETPQDPNVNEEMAQDMLDDFVAEGPDGGDLEDGDIEEAVEEVEEEPSSSFLTILSSIISRFRGQ